MLDISVSEIFYYPQEEYKKLKDQTTPAPAAAPAPAPAAAAPAAAPAAAA